MVQNGVLNLVQNGVMNKKMKNFVMNAKIDPKVVMDLFILKIWWMEQFCNPSIENCWKSLLMGMNLGC